jgi:hypothetical protein
MSLGVWILISSQGVRKPASYGLWKNVFVQVRVFGGSQVWLIGFKIWKLF